MGLFRFDPIRYFSSVGAARWVGNGRYFMVNYADTLTMTPDSTGRSVSIRRVLVNNDDTVVVSRGRGTVVAEPGDSTFALRWSESRYPEVTGRMRWQDGQWVISFDGSWSAWSIRIRYDSPFAVVAAAARSLGSFPPMELTTMTYRARAAE
ncbi:MAG: hypothetical protein AB1792_03125 [Candidatus Zixiibacteriota bacterium]